MAQTMRGPDDAAEVEIPVDAAVVSTTIAEERVSVASQWQLMWWRFRRHKVAMASAIVVVRGCAIIGDSGCMLSPSSGCGPSGLLN